VYDALGQLAAEYSTAANSSPCATCYLSYDHLGSVLMVTDQNAGVVARHDYLPFGEEIPGGSAGRNSQWSAGDAVSQRFTGKERDQESGLDWFSSPTDTGNSDYNGTQLSASIFTAGRYYSSPSGRFTSPDIPLWDQDPMDPQSWNLYSYVRNNPLRNIDPTGMSCVQTDDGGYVDDNDGQGCAAAGAPPNNPDNPGEGLNQGQINAQATAQNPSDLEYWWTISTKDIQIYVPNDVPLSPYTQALFTHPTLQRTARVMTNPCTYAAWTAAAAVAGGAGVGAARRRDCGRRFR
jgi:RHS repeat-associated protein